MRGLVAAGLVLGLVAAVLANAEQRRAVDVSGVSYAALVQMSAADRQATLDVLPRAERLALTRTRAERWLDANRSSLSRSQAAVVQETIDFISAARDPQDPDVARREAALTHRLACAIGEERASAAFTFQDKPPTADRSWSAVLDSWVQWLVECVAK